MSFFSTPKGIITSILVSMGLGSLLTATLLGFVALPSRVDKLEKRDQWIICTTIPPNKLDVLAALEISCEDFRRDFEESATPGNIDRGPAGVP